MIMFSTGEYSDYSVRDILQVPDDLDLDVLRKQFMDVYFPPFPEKLPRSYTDDMAVWNRAKAWENAQFDVVKSLGYGDYRSEDGIFIKWLVKEHGCVSLEYEEINLDGDLVSWRVGRQQ